VTVTGTVIDLDGDPVVGCVITPHSFSFDGREPGIVSDYDGRFAWPGLTAGSYTFDAKCIDEGEAVASGESQVYFIDDSTDVTISVMDETAR
jgi:hypothetical protein